MYIIVNDNNLYLMQIDFNDYSFTTKKELATKFMTEEGPIVKSEDYQCLKI